MTLSVHLLLTGDELMSGDIVDSNSAMIAQQLQQLGLTIKQKITIGDDLPLLVATIKALATQADIVIINGGLGPTIDDLTAQALAQATEQPLSYHPQALEHLHAWCQARGFQLNEPNKKQAFLPEQCQIIANPIGSAVGFKLAWQQCTFYCTPGVPRELKQMLAEQIVPDILQQFSDIPAFRTEKLQVFGLGESNIQALISEQIPNWPTQLVLGFRAAMPHIEVKLGYFEQDKQLAQQYLQQLRELLGAHVFGEQNTSLAKALLDALKQQHKIITTAESCTGGMIASELTQLDGCSSAFHAGFVTYDNAIKQQILNVPEATLTHYGAVSEQTVIAMLQGAVEKSQADLGVAVSGIAGPSGGTEQKPVGMVWLAWGNKQQQHTCCLYLPYGRQYFQRYVTAVALDLCRRFVLKQAQTPNYIEQRRFDPNNIKR